MEFISFAEVLKIFVSILEFISQPMITILMGFFEKYRFLVCLENQPIYIAQQRQ